MVKGWESLATCPGIIGGKTGCEHLSLTAITSVSYRVDGCDQGMYAERFFENADRPSL